jgi:hypothetical protein
MANLNLFGVPLSEAEEKETGTSKETQKVLRDLIDIVDQTGAEIQNFNIRKSFVYYDVSCFFRI